jgi:hypothetical protein
MIIGDTKGVVFFIQQMTISEIEYHQRPRPRTLRELKAAIDDIAWTKFRVKDLRSKNPEAWKRIVAGTEFLIVGRDR